MNSYSLIKGKNKTTRSATTDDKKASSFGEHEARVVLSYSKRDGLEIRRVIFIQMKGGKS